MTKLGGASLALDAGTSAARATSSAVATLRAAAVVTPPVADETYPAEAIGIPVQRLGEIQVGALGYDAVVAIAGWYVPTAITDCPPLAAIYRDGALPYLRGDNDKLAFCVRSGVLYPSRPDLESGGASKVVPTGVAVTIIVGVVMPLDLETVGADATQVVVNVGFDQAQKRVAHCVLHGHLRR